MGVEIEQQQGTKEARKQAKPESAIQASPVVPC